MTAKYSGVPNRKASSVRGRLEKGPACFFKTLLVPEVNLTAVLSEQRDQGNPGHKTPDMSGIGNAASPGIDRDQSLIEKLQADPKN